MGNISIFIQNLDTSYKLNHKNANSNYSINKSSGMLPFGFFIHELILLQKNKINDNRNSKDCFQDVIFSFSKKRKH